MLNHGILAVLTALLARRIDQLQRCFVRIHLSHVTRSCDPRAKPDPMFYSFWHDLLHAEFGDGFAEIVDTYPELDKLH